jgi:hypothetical protein
LCDPAVVIQYQTDLPPIVPIVTQFNIETGFCPCCRQHWQGRHPEQTSDALGAAGNTLGPVVLTMAAEMKHRLGVSYRKIADFLATYSDLHVAPATFVRAEQRLANLARPTYELLLEALRQSHADGGAARGGAAPPLPAAAARPAGGGRPCTGRTLLIKVAAEVVVSTRRIVVRLSSSWPHLDWYRRVCERLRAPLPIPVPHPSD